MGEKIKQLRESKKLSRYELAELTGLSHMTIYRVESGESPTLKTLTKIAKALGVSVEELI